MFLNQLRDECHYNAQVKGFHDEKKHFATLCMLMVSEISEAVEAHREGERYKISMTPALYLDFIDALKGGHAEDALLMLGDSVKYQPETHWQEELADLLIRLMDMAGLYKVDMDWQVERKMKINAGRPRLHGKDY